MLNSLFRSIVLFAALTSTTGWSIEMKVGFILLTELIVHFIASKRSVKKEIEKVETNAPARLIITDASDKSACQFMDELWPVWIEIDEEKFYIFDGQYAGAVQPEAFILDELTVVLSPGIRYTRLTEDNRVELADMMGVPVSELELTT